MNLPKLSSVVAMILTCAALIVSPTPAVSRDAVATEEMGRKTEWVRQHLQAAPGSESGFFSLIYGGRPSSALIPSWNRQTRQSKIDDQRTEHLLSWTDPRTGLVVRCRAIEYHDFPTVEWTLSLKNTGPEPTPILEQIRALDLALKRTMTGRVRPSSPDRGQLLGAQLRAP